MIQLNLFKEYQPPHIEKWERDIKEWRPRAGQIARVCGLCWLYGEELIRANMYLRCYKLTCYIIAVTDTDIEVICPFLPDTPWCEQTHLIVPFESIEPEISAGFDEAAWREKHPILNQF